MAISNAFSRPSTSGALPEAHLRELSRRAKALLPTNKDGINYEKDVLKYVETFDSVIQTASSEVLSATQQVAAWNTLSTFLDQTSSHRDPSIRDLIWAAKLWQQSLFAFLTRGPEARPKSIKQLLTSLTSALQKTKDDEESLSGRQNAVQLLVDTILKKSGQWPVRPCVMLFSNLLRKDIINIQQICDFTSPVSTSVSECTSRLLEACMQWAVINDSASAAGQLLAVLLDKAEASSDSTTDPLWVVTLSGVLADEPEYTQAYRVHLMPVLFQRDHSGYIKFLRRLGIDKHLQLSNRLDDNGINVLLTVLQVGNDCGLVEITNEHELDASACPIRLPVSTVALLLRHGERSIRLTGLSLLVNAHAISQPLHKAALDALKANLPHLHADTDLNFRSELFSLTQRLLDRLRASTSHKVRALQTAEIGEVIKAEQHFMSWYRRFLMWELRPTASYQRHISALRCLAILMKSGVDPDLPVDSLSKAAKAGGRWPFDVKIMNEDFEQVLLNMLLDPFDDVRHATAALLETHIHSLADSQSLHERFRVALEVAERKMLASGRADQADAVAHIYALLYSSAISLNAKDDIFLQLLEKAEYMLDIAKASLATAVTQYPLHGILTSLRYLLAKPALQQAIGADIHTRFIILLHAVWQIVSPILCDDAPEGFLPEEVSTDAVVSSKVVLSYCWRALKEASLLGDTILATLTTNDTAQSRIAETELIELTFTQLAELRHRGAFSTVAQTWQRCCSVSQGITPLPTLLERVMSLIQKATINTRRSAGMPSLLCGILIADQTSHMLEQAFTQLDGISRQEVQAGLDDESSLPQVHAMNCLKDILKSTKLANRSERFVPMALQLAADSLPSKTWAIRNCGLMLFRAVVDRLLGTNDSYEDDTEVKNTMDFRQRGILLDQVLSLLPTHAQDVVLEGVFPALQLLQHSQLPEDRKDEVYNAVIALLGNRSWLIRDKAARTLVTIAPRHKILSENAALLQRYERHVSSHNMLHGSMLCLKHLVRAASRKQLAAAASQESLDTTQLATVLELSQHFAKTRCCPALQEAAQMLHEQVGVFLALPTAPTSAGPKNTLSSLGLSQALRSFPGPAVADEWMLGRSTWLNQHTSEHLPTDESFMTQWEDYVMTCESALANRSVFSSGELASNLCKLDQGVQYLWQSARGKNILLRICLLVYDLLNDDDEEIRLEASCAASSILIMDRRASLDGSLEPIVASHKLLIFMVVNGAGKNDLRRECLRRAFNIERTPTKQISRLLDQADRHDTDLFAEEKQNLYLDVVLESKAWTQAAKKFSGFDREDIDAVTRWAAAALESLLNKSQESTSGAFGWSTVEEVFAFGLRVIYAVEFLLHRIDNGGGDKLSIPPSLLRERLLKLQLAAKTAGLNPLWQFELDRVSKIAAVSRFSAIQSLLNGVVGQLSSATTLQ